MISASSLKRYCGYPRQLEATAPAPRTQRERDAAERKRIAADRGTVFHAAIERWAAIDDGASPVVNDQDVQGWIDLLETTWRPLPGMLFEVCAGLTAQGDAAWAEETAPGSHEYRRIGEGDPIVTGGRADVVWSTIESGLHVVTVRDWKTGRWAVEPASSNLQVTSLALAFAMLADADAFRREIYYVRDGYCDADPLPIPTFEARAMLADVLEAAALDNSPRPGPHCEPCWERRMKRCSLAQQPDRTHPA